MRLRVLIILITFYLPTVSAQVTNQRLFDTVGFIVDHYQKRVTLFQSETLPPGRMVFLGNSITEGGKWDVLTGDSTAINRGIGGDITYGVLKRLDEIIASKPSKVFLLIGINDIGKDIPASVIADNIRKIIYRFQKESPVTQFIVHSILPVNATVINFPQHYDKNEHVTAANKLIRELALKTKVTYVDLHRIFADKNGRLKSEYTSDGLHLNERGYSAWADHLRAKELF